MVCCRQVFAWRDTAWVKPMALQLVNQPRGRDVILSARGLILGGIWVLPQSRGRARHGLNNHVFSPGRSSA